MKRLRTFFHKIKVSNFVQNIELPTRSVLIIAAVCVSVVAIALTYRIKEAKMAANPYSNGIVAEAGTSNQVLAADERVAAALADTQDDLLGALASSSNPFAPSPKDSISDRFTKDIIAAYAQTEYSQDGSTADPTTLTNNAISNIDTSTLPRQKYTISNVTIFVPKSAAEIKDYGNTFARVYLTTVAPVANNSAAYSADIGAVGNLYRQIAANLLKIRVPNDVAISHLQVVNDFALMADTFPLIDGEEKDPVKALLGLRMVQDTMADLPQMFVKINQYFKLNGIIFDKSEPGSLWNQVPDTLPAIADSSTDASQ